MDGAGMGADGAVGHAWRGCVDPRRRLAPGRSGAARGGAAMVIDSRRYHRRANPERLRHFGKNESSTSIQSPYGGLPMRIAGQLGRQQVSPLLLGLGLGTGRQAQRLQRQIESGQARGPMASAIRQIQQFAPGVIGGATDIGRQVSEQGGQAVNQMQAALTAAQQQMPEWQQATRQGLTAAQQGLTGAQDLYAQMQAQYPGLQQAGQQGMQAAQSALQAAQGALGGPATQGAQAQLARAQELLRGGAAEAGGQEALTLAQRYAQQAASPIANEDLYQMAARRALAQVRPGLAARGLEAGGAGAQAESDVSRDLAYQFAQNQAAQRQATLQGLTGAATGLGNIQSQAQQNVGAAAGSLGNLQQQGLQGLEGASTNVQQAAQNQAALGQTMLPYLQAIQQGGGQLGQAAQAGAGLLMTGPELAQQQFNAMNQYGQALMQQYNLPMQTAGNLTNLLTAGMSPGLQMLQATSPQVASSSKGYNIL